MRQPIAEPPFEPVQEIISAPPPPTASVKPGWFPKIGYSVAVEDTGLEEIPLTTDTTGRYGELEPMEEVTPGQIRDGADCPEDMQ